MLRSIESFTKQKIDILTVPTVAELRSKRLDVTRASIRELILAGELDEVRVVVDTLAQEFDIVAIASAAVKLAHQSQAGDEAERDIPVVVPHERPAPRGFRPDREARDPRETRQPRTPQRFSKGAVIGPASPRDKRRERPEGAGTGEEVAMLFVGAGREAGIRPGDLVGAITGEAGINSRELGAIQIADRFSLVEVPASRAEEIIAALKATTIRGRKVPVRRDRDAAR